LSNIKWGLYLTERRDFVFKALLQAIEAHDTIIIHRHSRPDGDALGSQIGLKQLLLHNYPHKQVYAVGDGAGYLQFMDGSTMDQVDDTLYCDALAIVLDTSSPALVSDDRYRTAHLSARLDHHIYQGKFTDLEATDDSFESCCGLITQFAVDCGLQLNASSAKALYTGMVTDSGRFRYDGTSARTFRLAAILREQDFSAGSIYRDLYAETLESKQLRASFVLRTKFTEKNVAYIYTTKEDLANLGVDIFTASRGMVNTMADLKGVGIWVNFTEAEEGVLCELRSAEINVNPIAVKYGGGGHAKACGATVANYEEAMAMLADLDRLIGEYYG
jgi:phosphoesterase RecJ-like protein